MDETSKRVNYAFERYRQHRREGTRISFEDCLDEALFVYDDIPIPEPKAYIFHSSKGKRAYVQTIKK